MSQKIKSAVTQTSGVHKKVKDNKSARKEGHTPHKVNCPIVGIGAKVVDIWMTANRSAE